MTPYAHHANDLYLNAYRSEMAHELAEAHHARGDAGRARRAFARALVRTGARMLPGTPESVGGGFIVMSTATHTRDPAPARSLSRAA
jgi:hypothetical protein